LLAPVVVLLLTLGAIAAVSLLVDGSSSSREAQLRVASMKLSLADLQSAPSAADPAAGGDASTVRDRIQTDEESIADGLTSRSQAQAPARLLAAGRSGLTRIEPAVAGIYFTALAKGGLAGAGSRAAQLQGLLIARSTALTGVLEQISAADATRAAGARAEVKLGAATAMALLLLAFAYFYFRSVAAGEAVRRLAHDKETLLGASRVEARTDVLTGLGNRRALAGDLARAIAQPLGSHELLLAMFDLDGFKRYNDSFGHAAGDALLRRLGRRLAAATERLGEAYRMGGDEFCMLARCSPDTAERLLEAATAALQDASEKWNVGCSMGAAWIPSEAGTDSQALKLADERMYANKRHAGTQFDRAVVDALTKQIGSATSETYSVSAT
jgi:diguanylate cyclase (GGDEF)-like protein